MGNDTPDWAGQYNTSLFYPLSDMGELAVRLGSPVAFDRRGSVIWVDTFDFGLDLWTPTVFGAGSNWLLSAGPVEHPPFSANLVAGGAANRYALITRKWNDIPDQKVGLAAFVRLAASDAIFNFEINWHNGVTQYYALLKVDYGATVTVTITNGTGSTTLLSAVSINYFDGKFVFLKVVFDATTALLDRVLVAGAEFDVSANLMKTIGASTNREVSLSLQIVNDGSVDAQNAFLDSIVLTGAEPPN